MRETEKQIRILRRAVKRSMTALDDWLHAYASEHCDAKRVKEASSRVYAAGGTLAYLADVQKQNRKALEETK